MALFRSLTGSYGKVYKIDGTLALVTDNQKGIQYKQHGYKRAGRVVKIQQYDAYDGNPVNKAVREYTITNQAKHLGIKEPVIKRDKSYTVMRHVPGTQLDELINQADKLTDAEKKEISIALLKALKE